MSKDIAIAEKYLNKVKNAKDRNIPFNLSLTSFKNIQRAMKCYFTGVNLVDTPDQPNSRTIDRIDPTKGYEKGNVVACSLAANQFKAIIETTPNGLDRSQAERVIKKCYKLKVLGAKKRKATLTLKPKTVDNNDSDFNAKNKTKFGYLAMFAGHKEHDLTGKKRGKFTVIGYLGNSYWCMRCTCGYEVKLTRNQIKSTFGGSYCPKCY